MSERHADDFFDPYAELQLSPDAEPEIVKAAFKALAKKYHPDRFADPAEKAQAERKMAKINEAQQLLQDGYRPPRRKPRPEGQARPTQPEANAPKPPNQTNNKKSPVTSGRTPSTPLQIPKLPLAVATLIILLSFWVPKLLGEDHLNRALELEKQGQFQESLEHLNKAVSQSPHNRDLYLHRARIWEALGEPERANVDRKNGQPATTLTLPKEQASPQDSAPNQVPEDQAKNSESDVP